MKQIEWIFFDIGGTLMDEADQERRLCETVSRALQEESVNCSPNDVWAAMIRASEDYQQPHREAVRRLTANEEQYDRIIKFAKYEKSLLKMFPGVEPMLKKLRNLYHLGIIANNAKLSEQSLFFMEIRPYFEVLALSADLDLHKPDPAIFRYALEQANCPPEKALYVGDRLDNDIAPAKALGMATVRAMQGVVKYQQPRGAAYEADYTVENIADLIDLLKM